MNYYSKIFIIMKIIILNVIIVRTNDELNQNTENQTSITIDDLNILIRKYPAFIQLKLQKQEYYTGKDIARCPMPYNENTILDDPDVVEYNFFNPRDCKKPWTWTRKNEIDVPVPIDSTVGQKLGDIIRPCIKDKINIIQCYTHYLNVIESVGLTLIDRFCMFQIEFLDRILVVTKNIDYLKKFSLFNIKQNTSGLNLIFENAGQLAKNIYDAFTQYYISTLPLNCISNITKESSNLESNAYCQEQRKQILNCRQLMKSKINYAILENDQDWEWDITSVCKPDDSVLMTTQYKYDILGLKLFPTKVKRFFRRLATLFKCCVSENKKHNTSGDVQLDVKNIECRTTQMNDIDVENVVSVGSVSIVKQDNGEDMIAVENMNLPEDTNDLCFSHILTKEDRPNNSTPELRVDCIEDLLTVKQEIDEDMFAVENKDLHDDVNELCISYIFTEEDHPNNSTSELKVDCTEDLFTVKQENGEEINVVENMNLHEDTNDLCISYIFSKEDHPNNDSPELEVTAIEEAVSMETRKHEEGVIRYFGMNNEAGRIISKNGKCYKFYKKDIVGSYKYYKSPQKAKFVVNDSQPNWAKDVEIVGDIYGQRCYYCLTHGHYTEECIQLDIDSLNFYYPYI
ncbi:uncharacterized protein LOC126902832 [Daktulosphaira vitifoliae]|uniref:uncharacterized protein LOC126902832 n=1 Tax=Daktulosphaira vitifoliae TaxID=58002 RepID=UPI0021AA1676|nr:uncharacterized protein LOC126902832 [Daktulosphaira vitifoliae]